MHAAMRDHEKSLATTGKHLSFIVFTYKNTLRDLRIFQNFKNMQKYIFVDAIS